jgi:hypothetical protein
MADDPARPARFFHARLTDEERRLKDELADLPEIAILQLIYQQKSYEGHAKDYEFSGTSMRGALVQRIRRHDADAGRGSRCRRKATGSSSTMCTGKSDPGRQRGGSNLFACISAKHFLNIASVSMNSWKPACISLMVETIAAGPGVLRP